MEKEYTHILMVQSMKVIGLKISSMAMESKDGLMEHHMRVCINKGRNMVMESLRGQTAVHSQENSMTTIFMVAGYMNGQMGECSMESRRATKRKNMVHLPGLMEGNIKLMAKWNVILGGCSII